MAAPRAVLTVILAIVLLAPLAVEAQQTGKVHRIGFLGNSTPALEANLVGPFREGLRELGHVEGQNILIEYRWAEGKYERLAALAAELLARNVEVIVTAGTPASLAVKKATTSTPLIMVAVGDPVATGLVASLARPGGNITGLTSTVEGLEGKRLELLKEVIPTFPGRGVLESGESDPLDLRGGDARCRPDLGDQGAGLRGEDLGPARRDVQGDRQGAARGAPCDGGSALLA
jgi:ABC-type uncharacterized transport system substrate-binding protein